MAYEYRKFYIDGQWVDPANQGFPGHQSGTEEPAGVISMGSAADVDRASLRRAGIDSFSQTTREERRGLLETILKSTRSATRRGQCDSRRDGAAGQARQRTARGIGVGHLAR